MAEVDNPATAAADAGAAGDGTETWHVIGLVADYMDWYQLVDFELTSASLAGALFGAVCVIYLAVRLLSSADDDSSSTTTARRSKTARGASPAPRRGRSRTPRGGRSGGDDDDDDDEDDDALRSPVKRVATKKMDEFVKKRLSGLALTAVPGIGKKAAARLQDEHGLTDAASLARQFERVAMAGGVVTDDGERAFHKFLKRAGVNHNHRAQAVAGLAENIGNTA